MSIKKTGIFLILILVLLGTAWIVFRYWTGTFKNFQIICFDVGKADAFLIETQKGNVVIDTGLDKSGKKIVEYLEEHKITSIDYMIITHFDKDHVGGADSLIKNIEVNHVLQPVYQKESKDLKEYEKALQKKEITPEMLTETFVFSLGNVKFSVNPPGEDTYEEKQSNNSSLITSITYGKTSFLFTGDAEDERLTEYLKLDSSAYTFLKVPYHGHYQSGLPEFFQSVNPEYAVITSSDKEQEDLETVDALKSAGCKVYYTRKGRITVSSNGKKIRISQ